MKQCTKCGESKPESEFYAPRSRKRADGSQYLLPSCKACFAVYYRANSERQKATCRRHAIKRRYGLTVDEYDALVAEGCSICGAKDGRIVVDHCHVRNSVRGPLCDPCNIMLGGARDDTTILRAAITYLERHAAP